MMGSAGLEMWMRRVVEGKGRGDGGYDCGGRREKVHGGNCWAGKGVVLGGRDVMRRVFGYGKGI